MSRANQNRRYGEAALNGLLKELATAGAGHRNDMLNKVSHRVGVLAAAGAVDLENARQSLVAGGVVLGLSSSEASSTVRSGLQAGQRSSATSSEMGGESAFRISSPLGRGTDAPDKASCSNRPPNAEVQEMWSRACVVGDNQEADSWLRSRGIPVDKVELFDLARAIPNGTRTPRWAGCKGSSRWFSWSVSHRLVVRGWGASGLAESLHARALGQIPEGLPKGLWPAMGPGSAKGLVMAEPLALLLLNGTAPSWWTRQEVVIAEGLPDFLSWSTNYSESDPNAPAVFGVTAGGWSVDIAARVPDSCRVVIATHHDKAGNRYAAEIARTFTGRKCEMRRWTQR